MPIFGSRNRSAAPRVPADAASTRHLPTLIHAAFCLPSDTDEYSEQNEKSFVISVYECHLTNLVTATKGKPNGWYYLSDFCSPALGSLVDKIMICRNGDHIYLRDERTAPLELSRLIENRVRLYRTDRPVCIGTLTIINI